MYSASHLISIAFQFAFVAALAFGIFVAIVSHLRYQDLFKESAVLERSGPTGLLENHVASRIGAAHEETAPFTVMLIKGQQPEQTLSPEARAQFATFLSGKISGALRRTDSFVGYGEDRFAVVVDVPLASAPSVITRINDAVRKEVFRSSDGIAVRASISIGVSSCPENGHRAQMLRENSEAALATALATASLASYTTQPPAPQPHSHTQEDAGEDQRNLLDPLTGVLRDTLVESTLQKYVARYRDGQFPVSIICFDVDYLNRYNEQYGQKIGDTILRNIGQYLQGALREPDLIARCDGDQFVVALCATPQEALLVAQRLATGIKRLTFHTSGAPLKVAVSGGVAGYPDHGSASATLYLGANSALAAAKNRGRSTVVMYHSDMKPAKPVQERVDVF